MNFATESNVDRSIKGPEEFISLNVFGTQVLLDVASGSLKEIMEVKYERFTYIFTN